jgi:TolB-like protein
LTPISPSRAAGAAEGQRQNLNPESIAPVSDYGVHGSAAKTFGVEIPGAARPTNLRGKAQPSNRTSFFGELKRRNVHKVAAAYIVGGWAFAQGIAQVFPVFDVPNWAIRLLVLLIILGFPVAAGFAWLFELTPEGIKRTEEADAANEHSRGKTWIYVVVIGAVFSTGLIFLGRYTARRVVAGVSRSQESVRSDKKDKRGSAESLPAQSIAVLPFENLSSDKENSFFAEGIQDEILTRLAKVGALKVISRTSTAHLAHSPKNLPEIARQLGVANILEGSVQKAGDAVRVNVQLIRAATDDHVWAESYDRRLDDIFGVEKEVAQNVASALNTKLTGREDAALEDRATNNAQAYAAYLRGNTQFWRANEQSFLDAAQSYEQALRLDPQFAVAWAALGRAQSILYYVNDTTPARAAMAERAIAEAGRLQAQAPETQVARGCFDEFVLHDYKATADMMEQAHRTWPGNFDVLQLLAFATARLGEWQKSGEAWDKAIALNPRDMLARFWQVQIPMNLRDFSKADRMIEEGLEIEPNDQRLLAAKAEILQALGQLDQAQSLLQSSYDSPRTHVPLTPALLRLDPDFDSLRGDPRFQKLCRE